MVPVIYVVLAAALAGIVVAFTLPDQMGLLLIAVPALAIGLVLLRAFRGRSKPARKAKAKPMVVLDGSNVMYWKDNTPDIKTVCEVLYYLSARGFTPGVMFDANAGYLIAGKYQHDGALAKMLDLPKERVMVVPKGTPADPAILTAARDLKARIVTNDRFRDWLDEYPEARNPGHLIRGGYRDGNLWLELDQAAVPEGK